MDTLSPPVPSTQPHAAAPPPAAGPTMVATRDLMRVWGKGEAAQVGVDRVSLDIPKGQLVAIVGASGSGKSTLGALLAGIDRPTAGSVVVGDDRLDRMNETDLATWRGRHVGIVFQDFHLLPTLTASENVELGLKLGGVRRRRKHLAREALSAVGLVLKTDRLPSQLSGGEQQRVAIARAIARRPDLLVADEPTGNLDRASGHAVMEIIDGLRDEGTTVVFITHDEHLAGTADSVVTMVDGRVAV